MKTNHLKKKLALNKKTVAHLNRPEMNNLKGGVYTGYTCEQEGCDTFITCENTMCYICESKTGCPYSEILTCD
jgi:natural product precursor